MLTFFIVSLQLHNARPFGEPHAEESIYFIKCVIDAMQKVREREEEAKRQAEVWKNVKHEILIAEEDMAVQLKKITNEIDELKTVIELSVSIFSKLSKRLLSATSASTWLS